MTLLDLPTDELTARARRSGTDATGTRVTFSPKVFIPLTRLCRDRCGYCTFATAPHHIPSPYLTPDEVLAIAGQGAEAGCHEALFTLGEAPEERYAEARELAREHGYASTVDYLVAVAGWCSRRRACSRTPTPARSPATSWRRCGRWPRPRG